jgi:L-2-hydroxyglutarate oxidase
LSGNGIIGLVTAAALADRFPCSHILVLEKEDHFAQRQTGRNSGVVHAAVLLQTRQPQGASGARRQFVHAGILRTTSDSARICGKIIVFLRGIENRVPARSTYALPTRA